MDFDPSIITYTELLDLFWKDHDPLSYSWSQQYQAALYAHNETQLQLATSAKKDLTARNNRPVHTVIEPLKTFFIAEDYHQKHYLQQFPLLMREFETYFHYFADFNDSPAASKVNGFASGKGCRALLTQYLPKLTLTQQAEKLLMERSAR